MNERRLKETPAKSKAKAPVKINETADDKE